MIKLKRGDLEKLKTAQLECGEIVMALDTNQLFVVDSNNSLVLAGGVLSGKTDQRPESGIPGRLFFDEDTSLIYIDTGLAWLSAGIPDAPSDNKSYVRKNNEWIPATQIFNGTTPPDESIEANEGDLYVIFDELEEEEA